MRMMPTPLCLLLLIGCMMPIALGADKFACGPFCSSRRGPQPTCTTVCTGPTCKAIKGNINGNTLFLDVSGEVYPPDGDSQAVTPAGCCAACKTTDGCNSWVVCNNPKGCGSGCKSYVQSSTPGGPPERRLGTFHSCTSDDGYPYQMCSLKSVANTAKPPLYPNGAAEGWVSGTVTVTLPAGCPAGITAGTCKACTATKSFSQCTACAQQRKQVGPKPGCTACASLKNAAQRDACIKVVVAYGDLFYLSGCGNVGDATNGYNVKALQSCFDKLYSSCSKAKDPASCSKCFKTTGGLQNCVTCANLPDPVSRARCLLCLSKPTQQKNGCDNCLAPPTTLAQAARCINCYSVTRELEAQTSCYNCYNNAASGTCLDCVEGIGKYKSVPWYSRKGCIWFTDGKGEAEPDYAAGIACLKAARNGFVAQGCYECDIYVTGAASVNCLNTLKKQKTTRGKLYTRRCFTFDGTVNTQCLSCVDTAKSDPVADDCVSKYVFGK